MYFHKLRKVNLVLLIGLLSVSLVVCSGGIAGTYVHDKNHNEYLELRRDSTFFLKEHGMGLSGKYRVDGDTITLIVERGMSTQGKMRGNTLIDDDGESWVKR